MPEELIEIDSYGSLSPSLHRKEARLRQKYRERLAENMEQPELPPPLRRDISNELMEQARIQKVLYEENKEI